MAPLEDVTVMDGADGETAPRFNPGVIPVEAGDLGPGACTAGFAVDGIAAGGGAGFIARITAELEGVRLDEVGVEVDNGEGGLLSRDDGADFPSGRSSSSLPCFGGGSREKLDSSLRAGFPSNCSLSTPSHFSNSLSVPKLM